MSHASVESILILNTDCCTRFCQCLKGGDSVCHNCITSFRNRKQINKSINCPGFTKLVNHVVIIYTRSLLRIESYTYLKCSISSVPWLRVAALHFLYWLPIALRQELLLLLSIALDTLLNMMMRFQLLSSNAPCSDIRENSHETTWLTLSAVCFASATVVATPPTLANKATVLAIYI